jgi:hypothetical protein
MDTCDTLGDAATLLKAIFEPEDHVRLRPIETWTGEGPQGKSRKCDRTLFRLSLVLPRDRLIRELPVLAAAAERERANVFFGVCPRYAPRCGPAARTRGGATYDRSFQIRTVRVVWADLDHCGPGEALARCEAAELPRPTAVVRSGNGSICIGGSNSR